jgi:aldehyde dehydrogenase (NAD+)
MGQAAAQGSSEIRTEIQDKLKTLRATYLQGSSRPYEWRVKQLRQLKKMLLDKREVFAQALKADHHRHPFETWVAETGLCVRDIDYTLKHLKDWMRPERVSTPMICQPGRSRIHREPYGVVLVIAPWNYPLQLAMIPVVGALAAGNTVFVKPSEVAPHTSQALAQAIEEYLDPQAVNVIEGGVETSTVLLEENFDYIMYTGSGDVGKIVMSAAAKHLTPVTLELGGKSPCVVDRKVDLKVAARRIIQGKFTNSGQTCIAPDYLLIHQDIFDDCVQALGQTIKEFYGQDPKQSDDYSRVISAKHYARLKALLGDGKVVCGGDTDPATNYIAPTLIKDVKEDSDLLHEEIFGPILPLIPIRNLDEAIATINARPKPLALYLFSKDKKAAQRMIQETSAGSFTFNDAVLNYLVPELPFGGTGASGLGAYHGRHSFETFSHAKAVMLRPTFADAALRYPPFNSKKFKFVSKLLSWV